MLHYHFLFTFLLKWLLTFTATFLVCWVPFFTCNILDALSIKYNLNTSPGNFAFQATTLLGYINSCLNPLIYTIFNPEFRKAFKKILGFGHWKLFDCQISHFANSPVDAKVSLYNTWKIACFIISSSLAHEKLAILLLMKITLFLTAHRSTMCHLIQ